MANLQDLIQGLTNAFQEELTSRAERKAGIRNNILALKQELNDAMADDRAFIDTLETFGQAVSTFADNCYIDNEPYEDTLSALNVLESGESVDDLDEDEDDSETLTCDYCGEQFNPNETDWVETDDGHICCCDECAIGFQEMQNDLENVDEDEDVNEDIDEDEDEEF